MHTKIRYELLGGHVHMQIFVAKNTQQTYAGCGELCVRESEFNDFQGQWRGDVVWVDHTKAQPPSDSPEGGS